MNQTELNKYKAMLEAKQAELSLGLRNREDIAIEKTPDALDEVQLAGEREFMLVGLSSMEHFEDWLAGRCGPLGFNRRTYGYYGGIKVVLFERK